jgi:WD40 repeat protein
LSSDGQYLGIADRQQTKVWKITSVGLEPAWQSPEMGSLAFTPDAQHAIAYHATQGLLLVHAADGTVARTLAGAEAIIHFAFHAGSRCVAVCTATEIRIYNWDTGQLVSALPGKEISLIAWHPSGRQLAIWSVNKIKLLEIATGKTIVEMPHGGYPQKLLFTADGGKLVSCSLWDSHLLLWDVGTGHKELEIHGFANLATDVAADGRVALFRADGSSIELWELADGSECRPFPRAWFPPLGACGAMSVSPDGRLLVTSGEKGLELWDLEEWRRVAVREDMLCAALFDEQGNLILSRESGVYGWPRRERTRAQSGRPATTVISFGPAQRLGSVYLPTSLATSRPKRTIVYDAPDGWHATSLTRSHADVIFEPPGDPRKAALSDDEHLAAVAGWESSTSTVWNVSSGKQLAELPTGKHGMLEFSSDGRWLASTPAGVRIWSTADWTLAHELRAQGTTPTGLGIGFSADGRVLAVGQPNGELSLFDPRQGVYLARFTHPTPNPSAIIAFTPDNRRMITLHTSEQTPGRIWDLAKIRRALREFDLDWPADVMQAGPEPTAHGAPLEVEWTDNSWMLLKSAVQALQGSAPAAGAEPTEQKSP